MPRISMQMFAIKSVRLFPNHVPNILDLVLIKICDNQDGASFFHPSSSCLSSPLNTVLNGRSYVLFNLRKIQEFSRAKLGLKFDPRLKPIPPSVQPDALQQIDKRHNPRNNVAIQFSVLSFSLLEHNARGIASHLEVFAICVTARFYLSLLILCSITAFWRTTLGKRAWVTPVTGEEWSVNIKVWVNVLGEHSTIHPPHVEIGLLSMLIAAAAAIERHPSHVMRSPTNPRSEFAISLADYGPIDAELKREWRWSVAARLLAD
ncbi:hypothetical protein B0H13DRAFT_2273295 [Mycena leptocephala]|nr:hypothetical protein B0H13DRAFT_2273295 [Mycena leptocephala]